MYSHRSSCLLRQIFRLSGFITRCPDRLRNGLPKLVAQEEHVFLQILFNMSADCARARATAHLQCNLIGHFKSVCGACM